MQIDKINDGLVMESVAYEFDGPNPSPHFNILGIDKLIYVEGAFAGGYYGRYNVSVTKNFRPQHYDPKYATIPYEIFRNEIDYTYIEGVAYPQEIRYYNSYDDLSAIQQIEYYLRTVD